MNAHIVFGLFALYVSSVSLYMVLSGQQDSVLANLRRWWGRRLGHSVYFVLRVALPMLICILCLGWGVRNFDPSVFASPSDLSLTLNLDNYRELIISWQSERALDTYEILYGA